MNDEFELNRTMNEFILYSLFFILYSLSTINQIMWGKSTGIGLKCSQLEEETMNSNALATDDEALHSYDANELNMRFYGCMSGGRQIC